MVNFKETFLFLKIREGVQHFPGGGGGPIAYSLLKLI